jgi:hypothetical protein
MALEDDARRALEELHRAMVNRPRTDGHAFSESARHLSLLRDGLARQQRRQGPTAVSRKRLEHVNAIISVVLAGHFPLGAIPWDELDKARAWLTDITNELAQDHV